MKTATVDAISFSKMLSGSSGYLFGLKTPAEFAAVLRDLASAVEDEQVNMQSLEISTGADKDDFVVRTLTFKFAPKVT